MSITEFTCRETVSTSHDGYTTRCNSTATTTDDRNRPVCEDHA